MGIMLHILSSRTEGIMFMSIWENFRSCYSNDKAFYKIHTWTLIQPAVMVGTEMSFLVCAFTELIFPSIWKICKAFKVNELNGLFREHLRMYLSLVEFSNIHMWKIKSKPTRIKTSVLHRLLSHPVSVHQRTQKVAKYIKYINIENKKSPIKHTKTKSNEKWDMWNEKWKGFLFRGSFDVLRRVEEFYKK